LVELAFDVVQKFQLLADRQQVRLQVDAPPSVVPVCADLGLIERVLDNLIGNALRHSPDGGTIRIEIGRHDGQVGARVIDTGTGIAAQDLPHIFDRYYRGGRGGAGGAGLGLAIARRIVELHGGTLAVESAPGRGSTFSFALAAHAAG
jgi:hypothetical protein